MAVSPKLSALQNLQNQIPVANQKMAAGMKAARDIQIQQAVAKAPVGGAIAPAAQQTAAAVATQAGQQAAQQGQQAVQQAGQVGQLQLGEQQLTAQREVSGAQQAARQQEMTNIDRLGKLDMAAKKELYDNEMQFRKDEAGRTLFNQRQLADYMVQNAESDEQLKNFSQKAQQLNKRNLQAMETAYGLIMEDLKQKFALAEQAKDQEAKKKIIELRAAAEARMRKKQADAANNAAIWSTVTGVAGAAVGGYFGGPAGATAGYQAGSSLPAIFG
jgi:hypothetical protein